MIISVLRWPTRSRPLNQRACVRGNALLIRLTTIFLLGPLEAKLMHLNSQLQDVVNALALRLRLVHIIAPDITSQKN